MRKPKNNEREIRFTAKKIPKTLVEICVENKRILCNTKHNHFT